LSYLTKRYVMHGTNADALLMRRAVTDADNIFLSVLVAVWYGIVLSYTITSLCTCLRKHYVPYWCNLLSLAYIFM